MFCRSEVDLGDVDRSGRLMGFEHPERAQLRVEAGLGVADLLQLLQHADEAQHQPRIAAGKTGRAAAGGVPKPPAARGRGRRNWPPGPSWPKPPVPVPEKPVKTGTAGKTAVAAGAR